MHNNYITTFAKIVPNEELGQNYDVLQQREDVATGGKVKRDPSQTDTIETRFFKHFSEQILFKANGKTALLYPIRCLFIYLLSIDGKSQIFDNSISIYNYLVDKNFFPDRQELKEEFSTKEMLNLRKIADISKGTYSVIDLSSSVIDEQDIITTIIEDSSRQNFENIPFFPASLINELKGKNVSLDFSQVPCLHEKKMVLEIFIKAKSVNASLINTLIQEGYTKYTYHFFPPDEVVQKWAADYKF